MILRTQKPGYVACGSRLFSDLIKAALCGAIRRFSDDRRFFVLVLVLVPFVLFALIIVVKVSRWRRNRTMSQLTNQDHYRNARLVALRESTVGSFFELDLFKK
jgi:hypothetical protein